MRSRALVLGLSVLSILTVASAPAAAADVHLYKSCSNNAGPGSGSVDTALHATRGTSGYLLETGVIRFSLSSSYSSRMLVRAYSGNTSTGYTSVYWNEITGIPNNTNTSFTFSGAGVVSRSTGGKVVYSPMFPNVHSGADGCRNYDAYASDAASIVYDLPAY